MIDQQATRLLGDQPRSNATAVMGFMTGLARARPPVHDRPRRHRVHDAEDACATTWTPRSQSLLVEAFNGSGSLASALTADHTFLNSELATFYGLPTTGLTTAFKSVSLAGSTRARPGPARDRDDPERLRAARHVVAHAARPHGALAHALPGRQPAAAERGHDASPVDDAGDDARTTSSNSHSTGRPAPPATSSWTGSASASSTTTAAAATATTDNGMPVDSSGTVVQRSAGQGRDVRRPDRDERPRLVPGRAATT